MFCFCYCERQIQHWYNKGFFLTNYKKQYAFTWPQKRCVPFTGCHVSMAIVLARDNHLVNPSRFLRPHCLPASLQNKVLWSLASASPFQGSEERYSCVPLTGWIIGRFHNLHNELLWGHVFQEQCRLGMSQIFKASTWSSVHMSTFLSDGCCYLTCQLWV